MSKLLLITCVATTALGCATPLQAADTSLAQKLQEEVQRDAPLELTPGSPLTRLAQLQFLFIAGFLHEAIPGYFLDNMAVTKELGAEASALFPPSGQSVSDTADLVHDEVLRRFEATGRPVVLVGHSKGGAEALLTVLRYPELVTQGTVDKVIVVQGAVGGSPVADGVQGTGAVGGLPLRMGLQSLTRKNARALFAAELERLRQRAPKETVEWVFSRVFYVRGGCDDAQVAMELRPTHQALRGRGSGLNDGLLLVEDQKLEDGGTDLGVLDVDHASLMVSSVVSHTTAKQRKAFTRALVREVFVTPR